MLAVVAVYTELQKKTWSAQAVLLTVTVVAVDATSAVFGSPA
jgi:hypothetical protein